MIHVIDHPVIADRLTRLRESSTPPEEFRRTLGAVSRLMVPAVTSRFATRPESVQTPLETTAGRRLVRPIVLVPILRAGLGLAEGFLDLLPEARTAHLGLARNEDTLQPETYYRNATIRFDDAEVLVLDPMLATGGSAAEAVDQLKAQGARHLSFVCLLAAPEGVAAFESRHPDVPIFTTALDRCLNEQGYICPGLGDAGDRTFATS